MEEVKEEAEQCRREQTAYYAKNQLDLQCELRGHGLSERLEARLPHVEILVERVPRLVRRTCVEYPPGIPKVL